MAKSDSHKKSKTDGQFRPHKLEPPRIGDSPDQYELYFRNYLFYVNGLRALKDEFWAHAKSPSGWSLETFQHNRLVQKGMPVLVCEPNPNVPGAVNVATEMVKVVRKEKETPEKKEPPAPQPVNKNVKKAAKKRQRTARRLRDASKAVTFSANLVKLAENNKTLAKSKITFGAFGVSPHLKVLQGRKKDKKKQPVTETTGDDSPPPPPAPPGPSSGPSSGGPSKKTSKKERKPNRKERRRAIYGPPRGSDQPVPPAEETPVAEVEQRKPAPFSFDGDSSSEDEKPPPKIWPPPSQSWQADAPKGSEAHTTHVARRQAAITGRNVTFKSQISGKSPLDVATPLDVAVQLAGEKSNRSIGLGARPQKLVENELANK